MPTTIGPIVRPHLLIEEPQVRVCPDLSLVAPGLPGRSCSTARNGYRLVAWRGGQAPQAPQAARGEYPHGDARIFRQSGLLLFGNTAGRLAG